MGHRTPAAGRSVVSLEHQRQLAPSVRPHAPRDAKRGTSARTGNAHCERAQSETMTQNPQTYEKLAHFISHEMRMSHVYQPVMLRELLKRRGAATITDVARALLAEDR